MVSWVSWNRMDKRWDMKLGQGRVLVGGQLALML